MTADGEGATPVDEDAGTTQVLSSLLELRSAPPQHGLAARFDEAQIEQLCLKVRAVLAEQPMLLELDAPMTILGDTHGQFLDMLRLMEFGGDPGSFNYLFLGDYVDRGKNSLECITLLFAYKARYPTNFFLLRGNHEVSNINKIYGFYDECKRRFSVKLWKTFCDAFNYLPVAALIEDRILCMHGGLSPELLNFEQIRSIQRPAEIPDSGLLCDLLWSDPLKETIGWGDNDRGVSFTFGTGIVESFCKKHDLDLICRAHQVVEDGYEFFAGRRLVTVFSAPNYCQEFDNAGALMTISPELECSFRVVKPVSPVVRTRGQ
mmetsp:Transcript_45491/g.83259  ORF Transcript_45491/g.83259 Transcript_45491/m.83259 type:complete len:319 (+) Transcript_45491:106-1062(+)